MGSEIKIVRLGDESDHGGSMTEASGRFTNGGLNICVSGDIHSCPIPGHGDTPVTGSGKLQTNGKKVIRVGDVAGCGAVLITGSGNIESD